MHTSSVRATWSVTLPPESLYGSVPCWKIGRDTSASYSSYAALVPSPQARSPSACGHGDLTPAPHLTQLLAVGAGLRVDRLRDSRHGSRTVPAVITVAFRIVAGSIDLIGQVVAERLVGGVGLGQLRIAGRSVVAEQLRELQRALDRLAVVVHAGRGQPHRVGVPRHQRTTLRPAHGEPVVADVVRAAARVVPAEPRAAAVLRSARGNIDPVDRARAGLSLEAARSRRAPEKRKMTVG